jgi:hypothetical protein
MGGHVHITQENREAFAKAMAATGNDMNKAVRLMEKGEADEQKKAETWTYDPTFWDRLPPKPPIPKTTIVKPVSRMKIFVVGFVIFSMIGTATLLYLASRGIL